MKEFFTKLGHSIGLFFSSLWNDFTNNLKHHWMKLLGYVVMVVTPIVYVIATYLYKKPEAWALPVFVWLPIIVLVLVYWCKARTYLAVKVHSMKVENNLEAGKHAGAIIIITTLQMIMTVAPFVIGYFALQGLEKAMISIKDVFFTLAMIEGSGSIFVVFDTIINVTKDQIEKPTEPTKPTEPAEKPQE